MVTCSCTCPQGFDGRPCKHQYAVYHHHHVNFVRITSTDSFTRRAVAQLGLGEKADADITLYDQDATEEDNTAKIPLLTEFPSAPPPKSRNNEATVTDKQGTYAYSTFSLIQYATEIIRNCFYS